MKLSVTLLLLCGTILRAYAQGGDFTYQGRLDDNGVPANGIYDLRFTIYDLDAGGSVVGGPLTNSAVGVSNGLFTVTLDFGAPVFTGAERWLELGVRTNTAGAFVNLLPRQPITATPYAIRAANFSGAVAASQLTGTISPSNIGAGSINSTMLAAGAVGSDNLAAGAVTTAALADGAVTAAKISSITVPLLLTTFMNPAPGVDDVFGWSLAAVGNDRVLIGATYDDVSALSAGAAYLFNANGTLLTTFTNPAPAVGDAFGWSVAAVGNDRVLIATPNDDGSADEAGAAYLFSLNGALLTTFTNPTPVANDQFGYSVAALGANRVVIGALYDGASGTDAGAAYLFRTNGVLLATFTNPTPASLDFFGYSMAAVGNDRVLISALYDDTGAMDAGAAYLFRTNGTVLTTFTNPAPAAFDFFGLAVAAMGNDRVLISAPFDDTGAVNAGVVYLFTTGGTLLTTFINPAPAVNDEFGRSIAVVGDRVVIAAPSDNAGASDSGSVYWFTTNGTLLLTVTNPTPASGDLFGSALASVGNDRVLVGAFQDDTDASGAGAAYLFTIDSYMPGLVAEAVHFGGVTSSSIAAGAVTAEQIAAGVVGPDHLVSAFETSEILTITNPTPANADYFGFSVASVGNDRLIIGTPREDRGGFDIGVAYLYSGNTTLLTTFTNPAPAPDFTSFNGAYFGDAVAPMGIDRVLIGAPLADTGATNAGAAYLLSTNGTLLATFTNPAPAPHDQFGNAVAAVGSDRVLIGATFDDSFGSGAGAAYLFSTNGTLLTAITNPIPSTAGLFGNALAVVGTDRVLIGARGGGASPFNAGEAYLFNVDGTLLTTFTNPAPAFFEQFGWSVAAMGTDRVLIGAPSDTLSGTNAGAAYLFSTDGKLLTIFANPTPASSDFFGGSVCAVGNNRVLIGAQLDDTGTTDAGVAYLFSTNGTLLTTFTNPTPATVGAFGNVVTTMGSDRVVISAYQDDTGAPNAGVVYLFTLETFAAGLVADAVRTGSVTAKSFDDTIGVWTRSGNDVYRPNGNVGIGTTSPQAPLHVMTSGEGIRIQGQSSGVANSAYLSFANGTGTTLGWVGDGSSGDSHTYLASYSNSVVLYTLAGAAVTANSSGNVGIRRSPAANALEVEGNASKTTAGSFLANSDARIKTDVQTVTGALDKLSEVRLVEFHYTDAYRAQHQSIDDRTYWNVIAQEFQQVFPDAVKRSGDKLPDGDDILQVDTYPLTIYSAAAIQELNRKLTAELQRRDAENAELKQSLAELKALVQSLAGKKNGAAK